jgi:hypothetical protein
MYGALVFLVLSVLSLQTAAAQQATGQYSGQYNGQTSGQYSGRVDGRGNKNEGISPEAGDANRESQNAKKAADDRTGDAEGPKGGLSVI